MNRKLSKKLSDNIFIQEKNSSQSEDRFKESSSFHGVPYLKRGDSSIYIEQFLGKDQPFSPIKNQSTIIQAPPAPAVVHEQPKQENAQSQQQNQSSNSEHQQPMNPSAFHNFQKHLTVALKHAVVFKDEDKNAKQYLKVAAKLWKAFAQSKICTKKVLHFLLGDRNEHEITNQDLRQFGFAKIYDTFGDKVVREARIFMMKEVLRQVKEQNCLETYFQHKKIKDKQKFKRYVAMFVEELQQGFLRKRLPRQKVAELIR